MKNIAFIGLGNMGGPMAANLVRNGESVVVFDLVADAVKQLEDKGAMAAASPQEAVKNADVVVTMLPAAQHVKSLYLGEQGIIAHAKTGALFIDCSTIDAQSAKEVGAGAINSGYAFIDAPVSGGVAGAAAGTLTFIMGGDDAAVSRAKPVLKHMGANLFHAGELGAGQIAKLCNNMLLSVLMVGTSEALQLGKANGLDPKVLSEIMLASSGSNWTLQVYNPWLIRDGSSSKFLEGCKIFGGVQVLAKTQYVQKSIYFYNQTIHFWSGTERFRYVFKDLFNPNIRMI